MTGQPWSAETEEAVTRALTHPWKFVPADYDTEPTTHHGARAVLTVLADAGLLATPSSTPDEEERGWIAQLHERHGPVIAQIRAATTSTAGHLYLSTACWHETGPDGEDLHRECNLDTTRHDGTHKTAATCKWCPGRCVCACHTSQVFEELTGWHGQPVREMPDAAAQEAPFRGSPRPVDGPAGSRGTPVVGTGLEPAQQD